MNTETDVVSTNEICVFNVNVKKFHKKFLTKFFTKNYGKVIKVRVIVEQSRFPNALALIRFEEPEVAQHLLELGKIAFSNEKDAAVHKIKVKKRLNQNQKKKKKKSPLLLAQKQNLEALIEKIDNAETAEISLSVTSCEAPIDDVGQAVVVDESNDNDQDEVLSTACSDISTTSESDTLEIKKKKNKRRNKNKPVPQVDFLSTIRQHKDQIIRLSRQYSSADHDRIASELTKILFSNQSSCEAQNEEMDENAEPDIKDLAQSLSMHNFLLFMNIMPTRELTGAIMDECVQIRAKLTTLRPMTKISNNNSILCIHSKNSKVIDYTTRQYRLKKEIDTLIDDITQTKQEIYHNNNFLKTIEKVCSETFDEQHSINPYGSNANGFCMRGSDIDLALNFVEPVENTEKQLKKLKAKLRAEGVHSVKLIGTRMPILKIQHFNVECDVCVNNFFAVINTKLLHTYSRIDRRLKEVVHVVRYWAKNVGINDSAHGTLSSYSYSLMVVFYFQIIGILPSLQKLVDHELVSPHDISYPDPVQGEDCRFVSNISTISNIMQRDMAVVSARVTELVVGFFDFFKRFDFTKHSICIASGAPVVKPPASKELLISILDPFERQRDLGCVISSKKRAQSIIGEIQDAAEILTESGTLKDVIENSVAKQFGSLARQWDSGHTFRRYPSPHALEKILNNKNFAEGVLHVESLDPVKAKVILSAGGVVQISTISGLNRAMHLDRVFIKKNTPTHGQVVTVLNKQSPSVFACVAEVSNDYVWMKPLDDRYPKMITTSQFFAKSLGCKQKYARRYNRFVFACQMESWKENERYPQVHSFEVLGSCLDPLTANRFIAIDENHYLLAQKGSPRASISSDDESKPSASETEIKVASYSSEIQQKMHYHNISAYLYFYAPDDQLRTEAIVVDAKLSSQSEIKCYLPKYGVEIKCGLTQIQPHPTKITVNERTNRITLDFDSENGDETNQQQETIDLYHSSQINVELTVDYDHYPNELMIKQFFV